MRRFVDLSVPLGVAVGIAPSAVQALALPASIVESMHGPVAAWWAFIFLMSCIAIVIGVFLRRTLPEVAFLLEYPGCITAAVMSVVYGAALSVYYGPKTTWLAIGFSLAIGLYFLARFLELVVSRRRALKDTT
jgi:hypothetical protein